MTSTFRFSFIIHIYEQYIQLMALSVSRVLGYLQEGCLFKFQMKENIGVWNQPILVPGSRESVNTAINDLRLIRSRSGNMEF